MLWHVDTYKITFKLVIYIEGMGQSQNTAALWPNWPTFY